MRLRCRDQWWGRLAVGVPPKHFEAFEAQGGLRFANPPDAPRSKSLNVSTIRLNNWIASVVLDSRSALSSPFFD